MPNIKKIVVSGSGISQLTNDVGFALATNITGAFTAVSTSIAIDIAALELAVGGAGGLLSGSAQIAADISGAFTAVSTSIAVDIAALDLIVGAGGLLSGSAQIATDISGAFTAVSTSIAADIAALDLIVGAGGLLSGSAQIATDISGAFTAVSGGLSTRIQTLEINGPTNAATASYVSAANVKFAGDVQTLTDVSTSLSTRTTTLEGRATTLEGTGTIQGVGTTNDVTFANITTTGNVSIAGTLFVDGTTTTINSTNLNIEDKFLLLNSGSTGPSYEGGIIVESGSTGTGNAFYYDASDNRWSLKGGLVATNTSAVTAEAFMSVVIVDTIANAESSSYYKVGNIIVDNQDIYIVAV